MAARSRAHLHRIRLPPTSSLITRPNQSIDVPSIIVSILQINHVNGDLINFGVEIERRRRENRKAFCYSTTDHSHLVINYKNGLLPLLY